MNMRAALDAFFASWRPGGKPKKAGLSASTVAKEIVGAHSAFLDAAAGLADNTVHLNRLSVPKLHAAWPFRNGSDWRASQSALSPHRAITAS
jgi:hypothetical protein